MAKFLFLQGANMEFLGIREPEKYGKTTAAELDQIVRDYAAKKGFEVDIYYTNVEGHAIDRLFDAHRQDYDGVVMNPGGFCYAGYALRDCIRGIKVPVIEVHMTNHYDRGIHSISAQACKGVFMGVGIQTYLRAFDALLEMVETR
ncbi:MAG: 3-dehydroquinate dehydratase [Alphaproteobacteria bacterium]|nr:3-dehydroquinate dehydratase [Alphaproteobacteria bacterium]MBU0798184.1 3-dehydroquinate dehydratase [Alphaproteobacteria bacterium]MBU0887598.1 3-dehydroquinate dehydratase [Alphaproteobacteria bacterium]MBU1814249.1 3-dehydroquinate dehydratase [Alphaproteobacteria bacterium]MBU2090547.1 3-dehydroquinate dehydratase [Alphaproteobacteria bacterium]